MENLINDNKLLHHLDRVNGDFRPITADVFLTNYCNNKCTFCTYNRWELDENSYGVSLEEFKKYVGRLRDLGVQGVILTGGGEPTINKDFDGITAYLERERIQYGINTNFNILKFIKPEYLKVSFDGWSEDSYEAVRGVRAYGKVRENVKEYAAWKKENSPHTKLGLQKVVVNPDDIGLFYGANADLDVDYIVFRPIESTDGKYFREASKLDEARRSIRIIEELAKIDSRVIMNYKWQMICEKFTECLAHWAQIAIDERGNVIYCCHKPYEIVGHIMDDDILERYSEARTTMKKCDVPCRLTAPNKLISKIQEPAQNLSFI